MDSMKNGLWHVKDHNLDAGTSSASSQVSSLEACGTPTYWLKTFVAVRKLRYGIEHR